MTVADPMSAGVTILTLVAVAYGGTFLLRVTARGNAYSDLQRSYFRAGHAHAGVLVILGLVLQILMSDPRVPSWGHWFSTLVLWSAIVMPAGFFLSAAGDRPERPNRLRHLIAVGRTLLTIGLVGSGLTLVLAA